MKTILKTFCLTLVSLTFLSNANDLYAQHGSHGTYGHYETNSQSSYQHTASHTQVGSYHGNGASAHGVVTTTTNYNRPHHGHYGNRPNRQRIRTIQKAHPSGRFFWDLTQERVFSPAHYDYGPYGRVWVPASTQWVTIRRVKRYATYGCGRF